MIKNETGYALVLVLVVMLALFMLGTALIGVSTSQVREAVKQQERVQAYYLAYSGANAVVEWVMNGGDVPDGKAGPVELDVGSFEVEVEEVGNQLTITSHGTVDGFKETVVVTLTRQTGGTGGGFPFPTDMAVFSMSDGSTGTVIKLSGSTSIIGSVGTNSAVENTIEFGPSANIEIDGNLYSMIDHGDPYSDNWEAPDPNNYDEWDSATSYSGGSRITYNGAVYEARHNTTGNQPGLMNSPWNEIINLWRDFNVYEANDEAWFDGVKYRAQHWTQNDQPDISNAWVSVAGLPFTQVKGDILYLVQERTYPQLVFPDFPNLDTAEPSSINVSGGPANDMTISGDKAYDSITVSSNRTLTIDMNGGSRSLRVQSLNISQGHIVLENTIQNGKLSIYVEDEFTLDGGSTINNNGNTEDIVLYYSGSQPIDIGGNQSYFGNIFVESANLRIGGSASIAGHILSGGNEMEIYGAADAYTRLLYAPNAHVNMTGSSKLKGSIISNTFDGGSGNRVAVEYEPIDEASFPFDSSVFQGNDISNGGNGGSVSGNWEDPQWSGGN